MICYNERSGLGESRRHSRKRNNVNNQELTARRCGHHHRSNVDGHTCPQAKRGNNRSGLPFKEALQVGQSKDRSSVFGVCKLHGENESRSQYRAVLKVPSYLPSQSPGCCENQTTVLVQQRARIVPRRGLGQGILFRQLTLPLSSLHNERCKDFLPCGRRCDYVPFTCQTSKRYVAPAYQSQGAP